jgi:peptidoglycan/xylan/chitin deacetylase (PgdA/CDA1 family)
MSLEPGRKLILGCALLAAIFFLATVWFRPWIALGVLFVSHILILYPTLVANCQWWGPVVTHFETSRPEVWLTIDDGPHPLHTPRLLEILQRFDAKATFFVIGTRARNFPDQIDAIRAAGHEIANHTATHPSATFWCLPPRRIAQEIGGCPGDTRYFRAPAGMKNPFVHPALRRRGLQLIGWTVRGLDTLRRDAEAVTARVCKRITPGAIVLLHEGHHLETDADFHPRCLELTLARLKSMGYQCVLPRPEQLQPGAVETRKGDC